ncbi:MAG TPA: SigE family RNA polymerase sigma factor [Frankiaceae bacterium]|nr:SigE family RNA polymerase sigma factor [Frankiaceae bacterium]
MEFEEYVAARGPALLRFAYVLTGDAHAAEDLTQAALADVLAKWRRVAAAGHPDAYVRRALLNRHLTWQRRRSSREVALADVPSGSVAGADAGVAARDEARRFLAGLPPRARAVLVLRYYADLDDDAIAGALGISQSNVRATASRALATLRARVGRPHTEGSEPR